MAKKSNQVDRIHGLEAFRKEVAQALKIPNEMTDGDLNIILRFLARDKGEIIYDCEVSFLIREWNDADGSAVDCQI